MNTGVSVTRIESGFAPEAAVDVVKAFLDYYWIRHALPEGTLSAWRQDLLSLERRLAARHRTLVSATASDLREFFDSRHRAAAPEQLPSLSCIRRFYFYLAASGLRADDPTENVYVRTPRVFARTGRPAGN